ncbi:MAG: type I restriction-modification system subunit M N-terminal domain-containing protein [Thermoleophilaceae bacterium]|nr:type I restriction-modification system subunit M N-terminal domain-containing protein [Thermoleophilaceae bacterium]
MHEDQIASGQLEPAPPVIRERRVSELRNNAAVIWSIADSLRGPYKRSEYGHVILPLTLMRHLDQAMEGTKDAVVAEAAKRRAAGYENPERCCVRSPDGRSSTSQPCASRSCPTTRSTSQRTSAPTSAGPSALAHFASGAHRDGSLAARATSSLPRTGSDDEQNDRDDDGNDEGGDGDRAGAHGVSESVGINWRPYSVSPIVSILLCDVERGADLGVLAGVRRGSPHGDERPSAGAPLDGHGLVAGVHCHDAGAWPGRAGHGHHGGEVDVGAEGGERGAPEADPRRLLPVAGRLVGLGDLVPRSLRLSAWTCLQLLPRPLSSSSQ